jgi:Fe-S cluster biogenesis protein NfuA
MADVLDPRLIERVEAALDEIRPALQMDGGSVEILEVTREHVLRLNLLGSCTDCPMSAVTLRLGIERLIFERVPEITGVEAEGAVTAPWDQPLSDRARR